MSSYIRSVDVVCPNCGERQITLEMDVHQPNRHPDPCRFCNHDVTVEELDTLAMEAVDELWMRSRER